MSAPANARLALIDRLSNSIPLKLRAQRCWVFASGLNGTSSYFYVGGTQVVHGQVEEAKLVDMTEAILAFDNSPAAIDGLGVVDGGHLVRAFGPGFEGILAEAGGADEGAAQADGVVLECAALIKPEKIDWLWPGWLARGKLHLLAGSPGVGKTTLALKLAAAISTGAALPDGSTCKPGRVLIWTGEDGLADTLVPRLKEAGADLHRIHFVKGTREASDTFPFDPATDLPALADAAARIGLVDMLMLDPLVAVMGDRNSHNNSEVRRALQPLVDLGTEHGAAIVGITHLSKGSPERDPLERIIGSIAFAAVARIVLVAANAKNDDDRILVRLKNNLGPDGGAFRFQIAQSDGASVAQWGEYVEGHARELLAQTEGGGEDQAKDDTALGRAIVFLRDLLTVPTPQKQVEERAEAAGHAWATTRRAAKVLDVVKRKNGSGAWFWALPRWPEHKMLIDGQPENVEQLEHLEQHEGAQGAQDAQDSLSGGG